MGALLQEKNSLVSKMGELYEKNGSVPQVTIDHYNNSILSMKNTLQSGILSLTLLLVVLLIIMLKPLGDSWEYEVFCNVSIFTFFLTGFSFFVDIFNGIEMLLEVIPRPK